MILVYAFRDWLGVRCACIIVRNGTRIVLITNFVCSGVINVASVRSFVRSTDNRNRIDVHLHYRR